jgi:mRNA-degrading endonuclease toxin of MazEF toxin-antitoxin module
VPRFSPFFRPEPQQPSIRQGGIYLLKDCPPLRGGDKKDRPVIVVSTPSKIGAPGELIRVVACSTSAHEETDPDVVNMPTAQDTPICKTGLWKSCYAVPEWYLLVRRELLSDYLGYLSGAKLREVVNAYLEHAKTKGPVATMA